MDKTSFGPGTINLIPSYDLGDILDDLFGLKVEIGLASESNFIHSDEFDGRNIIELFLL